MPNYNSEHFKAACKMPYFSNKILQSNGMHHTPIVVNLQTMCSYSRC